MNADLSEGMTDGLYKKIARDRGGIVGQGTIEARDALSDVWYGIHEKKTKVAPDGLMHQTPDWVPNSTKADTDADS